MKGFAVYKTDLGYLKICHDGDKIVRIKRLPLDGMQIDRGNKTALTDLAYTQLQEYFAGKRREFTFKIGLSGTKFQMRVWNALLDIPYGETRSYKDIAAAAGSPKGYRAAGMANNKNPLPIVVPCHRVIGSNGKMTGYAYGIDMKEYLLKLESKGYPG